MLSVESLIQNHPYWLEFPATNKVIAYYTELIKTANLKEPKLLWRSISEKTIHQKNKYFKLSNTTIHRNYYFYKINPTTYYTEIIFFFDVKDLLAYKSLYRTNSNSLCLALPHVWEFEDILEITEQFNNVKIKLAIEKTDFGNLLAIKIFLAIKNLTYRYRVEIGRSRISIIDTKEKKEKIYINNTPNLNTFKKDFNLNRKTGFTILQPNGDNINFKKLLCKKI